MNGTPSYCEVHNIEINNKIGLIFNFFSFPKQRNEMGKSISYDYVSHEFEYLRGLLIFLPFPKTFWSNIVTFKILNKPLKVFLL